MVDVCWVVRARADRAGIGCVQIQNSKRDENDIPRFGFVEFSHRLRCMSQLWPIGEVTIPLIEIRSLGIATTAIARELAAFPWAIAQQVAPQTGV